MPRPVIDNRDYEKILNEISSMLPFYTPELRGSMDDKSAGSALFKAFARMFEGTLKRLNQVPDLNLTAFLNMLGAKIKPACSARAPVTFKLSQGAKESVPIPAGCQLAADPADGGDPILFQTDKSISVTPASIKAIITTIPGSDTINDYTGDYKAGRVLGLFSSSNKNVQQHCLYLAHKDLFNIKGRAKITLKFKAGCDYPLRGFDTDVVWEWWDGKDWTDSFQGQGGKCLSAMVHVAQNEVNLIKDFEGPFEKCAVNGQDNYWIRCRAIKTPAESSLLYNGTVFYGIDAAVTNKNLPGKGAAECYLKPDGIFRNDVPLEGSEIYPLGKQPKTYDSFYIACNEALSKKKAAIDIIFTEKGGMDQAPLGRVYGIKPAYVKVLETNRIQTLGQLLALDTDALANLLGFRDSYKLNARYILDAAKEVYPVISWEYWNGKGWNVIPGAPKRLSGASKGRMRFTCPDDIELLELNGKLNYWIRARLVDGSFGRQEFLVDSRSQSIKPDMNSFFPPVIEGLKIGYNTKEDVESITTSNNLVMVNYGTGQRSAGGFAPFRGLGDAHRSIYLGFDMLPVKGTTAMLLDVCEELAIKELHPVIEWEYLANDDGEITWSRLANMDGTGGLTGTGILEFAGAPGYHRSMLFGRELYWIRGVVANDCFDGLQPEESELYIKLNGIYMNTTWASQCESISDEKPLLRNINGTCTYNLSKFPVVSEGVWCNEVNTLTADEMDSLTAGGIYQTKAVRNNEGRTTEFWVKWQLVDDLLDCGSTVRKYTIDRNSGLVEMGTGVNGLVLPQGAGRVRVDYLIGGGKRGNVGAGEIKTLRTSIPFVDYVTNLIAAGGGADAQLLEKAREQAVKSIRHRNRAVTIDDYEWLALEFTREIARVKAITGLRGSDGWYSGTGWVTVVIVPDSGDRKPTASIGLKENVRKYLEERASNIVASSRIIVTDPEYVEVSISATVYTGDWEILGNLERETVGRLDSFLHPLRGNGDGNGWDFGGAPRLSDVYVELQQLKGVKHIDGLSITLKRSDGSKLVVIDEAASRGFDLSPGCLIYSGRHIIKVKEEQ